MFICIKKYKGNSIDIVVNPRARRIEFYPNRINYQLRLAKEKLEKTTEALKYLDGFHRVHTEEEKLEHLTKLDLTDEEIAEILETRNQMVFFKKKEQYEKLKKEMLSYQRLGKKVDELLFYSYYRYWTDKEIQKIQKSNEEILNAEKELEKEREKKKEYEEIRESLLGWLRKGIDPDYSFLSGIYKYLTVDEIKKAHEEIIKEERLEKEQDKKIKESLLSDYCKGIDPDYFFYHGLYYYRSLYKIKKIYKEIIKEERLERLEREKRLKYFKNTFLKILFVGGCGFFFEFVYLVFLLIKENQENQKKITRMDF